MRSPLDRATRARLASQRVADEISRACRGSTTGRDLELHRDLTSTALSIVAALDIIIRDNLRSDCTLLLGRAMRANLHLRRSLTDARGRGMFQEAEFLKLWELVGEGTRLMHVLRNSTRVPD